MNGQPLRGHAGSGMEGWRLKPIEYCTMWKLGQALLLVIMLGVASPAFAAVAYVWEDDLGVIHLADDAATIPKGSRMVNSKEKCSALKLPKQALNFMVLGVAARHMATDPDYFL